MDGRSRRAPDAISGRAEPAGGEVAREAALQIVKNQQKKGRWAPPRIMASLDKMLLLLQVCDKNLERVVALPLLNPPRAAFLNSHALRFSIAHHAPPLLSSETGSSRAPRARPRCY